MKSKKTLVLLIIILVVICLVTFFIMRKINQNKLKYEIEKISEYNYFVIRDGDQYGVIDKEGKKIIDASYDKIDIPNPSKDVFICTKDEKSSAIDSNNKQLFSEYNTVSCIELKNISMNLPYEKSVLKIEKGGKYGLISFSGKTILETEYDSIENFSNIEGQLKIKKDGKEGIANIKGTIIIKPTYDTVLSDEYYKDESTYLKSGYIVGEKSEDGYKYGYIDNNGKLVLKLEYNDISRVADIDSKDGIFLIAAKNGQYGVIKNKKTIINNEYQSIDFYNKCNVFIIEKSKNYGAANISGKVIIPIENTKIEVKGEHIYAQKNNIKQVYDSEGNKVDLNFDESIIPTSNNNYKIIIKTEENGIYYGVLNESNKQIIEPKYLYLEYAFDNYFIACGKDGKLGIIDTNGKEKVELKYDLAQKVQSKNIIQTLSSDTGVTELYDSNLKKITELKNATIDNQKDYIKIYSDTELQYIDNEGKSVGSTKLFPNNKVFCKCKDGKWGFVDNSGKTVIDYEYDFASELNEYGYAAVKKDGKWGCINSEGKVIVEPKYKLNENYGKIEFVGEYLRVNNGFGNSYYTKDI